MAVVSRVPPLVLASAELFRGLPNPVLDSIAAMARYRLVPACARIFNQGDDDVRAHSLIEGSVRISQTGGDGAHILVRLIGPGETFGTAALFTDGRYPAEATAMTEALEASWSGPEFLALMKLHAQIALNTIGIVGKRLQEAQDRTRELATKRVEQRIAQTLTRLARQAGQPTPAGTAIGFPLRRKDVAELAGTTLHTASRVLSIWQKSGLLLSQRGCVTLTNPAGLQRIADDETH